MMKALVILAFFLGFASVSKADMTTFCTEEKEIFKSCGAVLREVVMNRGDSVLVCNGLKTYVKCVNDILIACPDYANRKRLAVTLSFIKDSLALECPGSVVSDRCSSDLVLRLTSRCNDMVPLTRGQSLFGSCRDLVAYETCLSEAAQICEGSPALETEGVVSNIQAAQTAVSNQC